MEIKHSIVDVENDLRTNSTSARRVSFFGKLPSLKKSIPRKSTIIKHKSVYDMNKSIWSRINALRVKCESGRQLTSMDTTQYRMGRFQLVLTQMLILGYHRSFSLLLNIHEKREELRRLEGPDSTRWNLPSLEQHPQLHRVRDLLCAIEDAQRNGDYADLIRDVSNLIIVMSDNAEDAWIVQKFVQLELDYGSQFIESDGGYLKAIANLTAGINAHRNNKLELAAEYLSRVFSVSYSHNWLDMEGRPLMTVCCEHLCNVYLGLACSTASTHLAQKLAHLKQAHEISKEAGLKAIEAICCLQLGLAFERLNNIDMAIAYFRGLYEVSRSIGDQEQLGQACEAMARCYEKLENIPETMRYLEKLVDIAESSCNWQEYARSCRILGQTHNRFGDFQKAKAAFKNSYLVTYCLKKQLPFSESKILTGVAEGNDTQSVFRKHMQVTNREALEHITRFRSDLLPTNIDILREPIEEELVTFRTRNDEIRQNGTTWKQGSSI